MTTNLENRIFVFGVPARMTIQSVKPGMAAGLWFNQRIVTESRDFDYCGDKCRLTVEMRFDDNCGNGHNSFAITATAIDPRYRGDRAVVCCGCMHEEIAAVFPELVPLIKWHLSSTDSPMHYVANTVYHASDRDHNGKRKGEVTRTEERLRFDNFPITLTPKRVLKEWLKMKIGTDIPDFEFLITPVPHGDKGKAGKYQYGDKFTFAGCNQATPQQRVNWTYAPFDSADEAAEWRDAIKLGYSFESVATAWSEGKERDFDAARACGVWPDATDEQLSVDPEELKAALLERLPALQAEMKATIESAGFKWMSE